MVLELAYELGKGQKTRLVWKNPCFEAFLVNFQQKWEGNYPPPLPVQSNTPSL